MSYTTIESLRQICNNCDHTKTDKWIGNQRFEARTLDRVSSIAARYGTLATSQMSQNNLMFVYDNALDGAEWKWEEMKPGYVQSRSTGGLNKFECGFDPQQLKKKMHKKRQETERMYIHREECMLHYIGSTLQDASNSTGLNLIRNNDDILTVQEQRGLVTELMVNDFRSLARAIDGTNALGNFSGENTGSVVNNSASLYPHYDGLIKQTLQQANAAFYASVDITMPAVGAGAYFVKWNGDWTGSFTSVGDVVAAINVLALDVTGELPYSASEITPSVIRVTANEAEDDVYGLGHLEIYYSATGSVTDCSAHLDATIVENTMPYAEQPLLFNYSAINEANFYDYFKDVIKQWRRKMTQLFEDGRIPDRLNQPYIAIDPLLLIEKDFAVLNELQTLDNALEKVNRLEQMFPRFVGLKVLEGTGMWYMTVPDNIIYLTNVSSPDLPVTEIWYDRDCGKVKSRNETLGNVLVADFSLIATNAKGSTYESNLKPAYQPLNLPHLDAGLSRNSINSTSDVFRAGAGVTYETVGANIQVNLSDATIVPAGRTIATYNWTIYDAAGGTFAPATQAANVTVTDTPANFGTFVFVVLLITLDDGSTDTVVIPRQRWISV